MSATVHVPLYRVGWDKLSRVPGLQDQRSTVLDTAPELISLEQREQASEEGITLRTGPPHLGLALLGGPVP